MQVEQNLGAPTSYYPDGRTYATKGLYTLYHIGRLLIRPTEYGISKITSVFTYSMQPHTHGRYNSKTIEILARAWRFITGGVIALVGLPFGALGIATIALANLGRKDFTFLHPETTQLNQILPQKFHTSGLRITSFNVGMMPELITTLNTLRPLYERIKELKQYLVTQPDIDIFCLQELFDEEAIKKLLDDREIRAQFPYIIAGAGRQTIGLNSGLAIFSRYPLKNPVFRPFTQPHDEDRYAKKGVLATEIQVSRTDSFVIFNTHLQSGHQAQDQEARRSEIQGLAAFENEYAEQVDAKNLATLVCGDLNISPILWGKNPNKEWTAEHITEFLFRDHICIPASQDQTHMDIYNLQEPIRFKTTGVGTAWDKNTPYTGWDPDTSKWTAQPKELDHFLIQNRSHELFQAAVYPDKTATCSDHLPITGIFKVNAK